jgi:hypothetical protein
VADSQPLLEIMGKKREKRNSGGGNNLILSPKKNSESGASANFATRAMLINF